MLLSSQLFGDKNANWVHLRWLPYLASLDDLGRYSWGSATMAWFSSLRPSGFNIFGFSLASRWAEYQPRNDAVDQRVLAARLCLDRLRVHEFVWEPYSSPDVAAVVHPEILVDEHRRLWMAHLPQLALNIDWLHAKDGRGGDRWFPNYYRKWHQHWEDRLDTVIPVDRVADPGPSAEYLDWWCRVAHRFLSPEVVGRSDNRRVDRRRRIGTRTTDREWRWLADRLDEEQAGADDGGVVEYRVPRRRAIRQGGQDGNGRARGRGPSTEDDGAQQAVGEDIGVVATWMDQPTYDVGGSDILLQGHALKR
ncbi:hypothetical protein Ahy_A09g046347 [Arachis hypogaea]|uniref:Aminotransferase-like plant mobile domain-containing protein n=1 Tax=Arachis hypogaea TaxID=3818 RepID=A0A445BPJ2_ARAHY|nr:hypothetical protein Ahy_A09g046347 [Arachis hypogaea]